MNFVNIMSIQIDSGALDSVAGEFREVSMHDFDI